jgi:ubiquinone/menaquinone biosynthesis C-methylase UbiE
VAFAHPERNLGELALSRGMTVVDIGAGSGAYALAAAAAVGAEGRVYAVDVQQELLRKLKAEARSRRLGNLEIIWGDAERVGGTKLREQSADVAILSNVLFQFDDQPGALKETFRILKSGGMLAIIDWSDSWGGTGPHPDQVLSKHQARAEALGAGFTFKSEFPAGDHHYGMLFHKS